MFQETLKKLPLTTIIISYFFVCGGLYLIGFWTIFNIDISSFIAITDIPKSFIFPFVITQGFYFFYMFANLLTNEKHITDIKLFTINPDKIWKRIIKVIISYDTIFSFSIPFIISYYQSHKLNALFWGVCSIWISLYLMSKVKNSDFFKTQIPNYSIRNYVSYIICFIPLSCFSTGKIFSIGIFNNTNIQYINIDNRNQNIDSCSLKFLGFLGDKLIVSSLDNKKVSYINQSSFTKVELIKK